MKTNLKYLSEKILKAEYTIEPFKHIYIENFISPEHFKEIISCEQIKAPEVSTDHELLRNLESLGYKAIDFPGCIKSKKKYLMWRRNKNNSKLKNLTNTACEGFGMVMRLKHIKSQLLKDINDYICGDEFNEAIAERFGVDYKKCYVDSGIQKYLDGYEISPHPDIRKKATTFMVNINPNHLSESANHHTHYMKFKDEYSYVKNFWDENPLIDTDWVPWDWCETIKTQPKNNSIVMFSPSTDTLHGVKANYNHLVTQRTQLYGNMWYTENPASLKKYTWEQLKN